MLFRNKNPRTIFLLTGISFVAGGIDAFENQLYLIAYSSLIVALLNFAALFFIKKHPIEVKMFMLMVNALFAALSSYAYIQAGMDKIQYGWALVAVINVIVLIVSLEKNRARKSR